MKLLTVMWMPLMLAAVNFLLLGPALDATMGSVAANVAFNVARLILMSWVGWLVVRTASGGLWKAGGAALLVMVVDHVILKGGTFLVSHFVDPGVYDGLGLKAFGGVLVSFVMFAPVVMLIGALGGRLAGGKGRGAALQEGASASAPLRGPPLNQ